jgi:PTS system nitrogen regulatory IIA component
VHFTLKGKGYCYMPHACLIRAFRRNQKTLNEIAHYLSAHDICLDWDVADKAALFDAIGQHIEREHDLSHEWVVQALSRREQNGSTGLGEGVASPHARVDGLERTIAVYARLPSAIPFDAPDDKPVSHVLALLIANPPSARHLNLLSEVARLFSDQWFRERLDAAADRHEVKDLFSTWRTAT